MSKLTDVEKRAAIVREHLASKENVLKIHTVQDALNYGDAWQAHANRMEVLLLLATAQRDSSDLLLDIAMDELARVRGV